MKVVEILNHQLLAKALVNKQVEVSGYPPFLKTTINGQDEVKFFVLRPSTVEALKKIAAINIVEADFKSKKSRDNYYLRWRDYFFGNYDKPRQRVNESDKFKFLMNEVLAYHFIMMVDGLRSEENLLEEFRLIMKLMLKIFDINMPENLVIKETKRLLGQMENYYCETGVVNTKLFLEDKVFSTTVKFLMFWIAAHLASSQSWGLPLFTEFKKPLRIDDVFEVCSSTLFDPILWGEFGVTFYGEFTEEDLYDTAVFEESKCIISELLDIDQNRNSVFVRNRELSEQIQRQEEETRRRRQEERQKRQREEQAAREEEARRNAERVAQAQRERQAVTVESWYDWHEKDQLKFIKKLFGF